MHNETINALIQSMKEKYVFPEIAEEVGRVLTGRLAAGAYDACGTGEALASELTKDLREVARDLHLRVNFVAEDSWSKDEAALEREYRMTTEMLNYGFEKVERLPGNIGYLDLRMFAAPAQAGETATAAMTLLAGTSALIVDLRRNGGGSPEMVQWLCSYLFDERTHLNSIYNRETDLTKQFWTNSFVPGKKFGGTKPVYVLTSGFTFSGGEEFAYNIKTQKRGLVIGEVTGGGANPGSMVRLNEQFRAFIPCSRAINPVTGDNWEGKGVAPDIEAPKEQAFDIAYAKALQHVVATLDPALKRVVTETEKALEEAQQALANR